MNRVIDRLGKLSIYIYALSLFTSKAGQNIGFGLGMIAFILILFIDRERLKKIDKNLAVFIIGITLGLAFFTSFSHIGMESTSKVLRRYYRYLMFFPLTVFFNDRRSIKNFLKLVFVSLLISNSIGIYKVIQNPKVRLGVAFDVIGYGGILAIASLFIMNTILFGEVGKKEKYILSVVWIITITLMIFSVSRGAYIVAFPMNLLLLSSKKRSLFIFGGLILLMGYFVMPNNVQHRVRNITNVTTNASNRNRINFWKAAIYTYKQNPVFGAGYGGNHEFFIESFEKEGEMEYVRKHFNPDGSKRYGNAHSIYFSMLSRFGLMTIFFLTFMFIVIPKKLYSAYKNAECNFDKVLVISLGAGFLAFYGLGLTENVITKQVTGFFFVTLMGLLSSILFIQKNRDIYYKEGI